MVRGYVIEEKEIRQGHGIEEKEKTGQRLWYRGKGEDWSEAML